mgnify:FL=1
MCDKRGVVSQSFLALHVGTFEGLKAEKFFWSSTAKNFIGPPDARLTEIVDNVTFDIPN